MTDTSDDTRDLAAILEAILREHGTDILEERSRLAALLRQRAPHDPRAVHLLVTAYDAGVPGRLREAGGPVSDFKIGQETAQIVDHFGSTPEAARAAVETWAKVLAGATDLPARAGPAGAAAESPGLAEPGPAEPDAVSRAGASEPHGRAMHLVAVGQDAVSRAGASEPPSLPVPASDAGAALVTPAGPPSRPQRDASAAGPATVPDPTAGAIPVAAAPPQRPRPLPLPGGAPPVAAEPPPLPPATTAPVRPLPGGPPPAGPAGIRPLPVPGGPVPGPTSSPLRWALLVPVVLAVGAGGLWASGSFDRPTRTGPVQGDPPPVAVPPRAGPPAADPPPAVPPNDPGPRIGPTPGPGPRAGGTTDEGFPIAELDRLLPFKAQQIDGAPNSLIFAFGLRSGADSFTYQAAIGFEGGRTQGIGLIKAVKRGKEASTGELSVTRVTEANGYVGFTLSGPLKGESIGAPSICVSALAGKSPDRFDIAAGEAGFCAFATKAGGVCDGDRKLGCGDLVP